MFLHRFKKELPVLDRPAKSILATASLALSLGAVGAQGATITGFTGDAVDGGALPPNLNVNQVEGPDAFVFFEGTTTLSADITVDGGGTITAGTAVDIHILHFDPVIPTSDVFTTLFAAGTVTFDDAVLGIVTSGPNLIATNNLVAGTSTIYNAFNVQQLEGADTASFAGSTVTFDLRNAGKNNGASFDQIRIFTVGSVSETVIPEPATLTLAAMGSLLMVSRRRRRD
ncbi:MAG: hypothetical protein AAGI68_01180 [Planctomycetota bacterium]